MSRAPSLIRSPYSPNSTVVPFVEPPIGSGILPFCALRCFTRRGEKSEAKRTSEGRAMPAGRVTSEVANSVVRLYN